MRTYAEPLYPLPIGSIDTNDVLAVLEPIWMEKAETAGRLRQRLERILDAAKLAGLRDGDNPARLKGIWSCCCRGKESHPIITARWPMLMCLRS